MSDEKSLPVAIIIDQLELQKKFEAWGKFGAHMYESDLRFQAEAQDIISQLVDPANADQIQSAENALATVKSRRASLQKARIAVTSKFDPVIQRLMKPEKDIDAAIEKNTQAVLVAKQKVRDNEKLQAAKAKELKDIAASVQVYVADMHASYLNAQLNQLKLGYEYALSVNLSMEALPDFTQKLCARVNLGNCTTPAPKPAFKYNTQEDVDQVVNENFNPWPAQKYVDGFALDVANKFSDWEQALKNKEAAKKLNDDAVAETTAAIDDQKTKQTTAARLEALAIPVTDVVKTKPLKRAWKIQEPENTDQMFNIINAFAVNRNLVEAKLGRIAPINVGVKQMIAALVAIKTDDNNFECTGITFFEIDKL